MSNRQLVKLAFCICLLPLFFSCSSERDEGSEGSGTLHVQVNANPEVVVGTNTRVGDGTEQGVPDVNDFSFSIFKGETLRGKWATLADFRSDDELTLRSGNNYLAKAAYGNVDREGFELPYYEGSQPFVITKGKTTNVEVTCFLANAKLAIVYTDAFKDYFATYTSEVSTSLGNTVEYVSSEERYAYFKPGDLVVRVKAKKKEGYSQEVTLKAKDFTAEARHAYILTLDVDAGTPSLNISFSDDIPNQKPVTIEISDEALSAPAPYFKANGFSENQAMTVVEGKSAEVSEVYAYLHAAGGIANCSLITHSASLVGQGWPEMVDLANISAETLSVMQNLGLQIAGLGEKKDKIAKIDFTNVIPFLEYTSEEAEHVFELRATDKLAKENQEPLTFRVHSSDNKFAVNVSEPVLYGTTKMKAKLTLDGDPAKVTYWLKKDGTEQQVIPNDVKSDGIYHELLFKFDESQYSDIQVEARYLRRTGILALEMGEPEVTLSLRYPGDVWTKQATLQLAGSVDGWDFQCSKKDKNGNEGVWNKEECNLSGSTISLSKLTPGTGYTYRFVKEDGEGDVIGASKPLDIETEEELSLPNEGMEEWSYDEGYKDWWRKWYPWNSEESKGWNTINLKTTADGGSGLTTAYAYIANSGTIQTTDKYEGNYAVLIRTVGWGKGSTAPGKFIGTWDGEMKRVDPGYLYLGDYSESPETTYYPATFVSRPTALTFYYKYIPAKGRKQSDDTFMVKVIVENRENSEIITLAEKTIEIGGINSLYIGKTIPLDYGEMSRYKATHLYILFKSGTKVVSSSDYDYFQVPSYNNLSDGQYIGSQLYIDDIKLEYAN